MGCLQTKEKKKEIELNQVKDSKINRRGSNKRRKSMLVPSTTLLEDEDKGSMSDYNSLNKLKGYSATKRYRQVISLD